MVRVLVYHKIEDPINFKKQLIFLKNNYTIISFQDLMGVPVTNFIRPPLLITFDDGDISLYKNAYPLLKEIGLPAVIFVITGLIGSKEPFWWDNITFYTDDKQDANALVWEVKKWPNKMRIEFIEDLKSNSKKKQLSHSQLTYDQLSEMQSDGIDIANHSHSHPLFNNCTKDELRMEMELSMENLEKRGFMHDVFAYPNGYFSAESENVLKDSGIKCAFIFDHKINKSLDNPLRISRLIVNDTTPLWKFRFILSGWHSKMLPLTRKISKIKSRMSVKE